MSSDHAFQGWSIRLKKIHPKSSATNPRPMSGAYVTSTQRISQIRARRNEIGIEMGKRGSLPNVVAWPPIMKGRARLGAWSLLILVAVPLAAQPGNDADVLAGIRDEAHSRSQILRSVHFLADLYGPRLTGSPNLKAAG